MAATTSEDECSEDLAFFLQQRDGRYRVAHEYFGGGWYDGLDECGLKWSKVTSLKDICLKAFIQDSKIAYFERVVVERCPRAFYAKLLAFALMAENPRGFAIRILLRHWPLDVLKLDDLKSSYRPFAALMAHSTLTHGLVDHG